MPGKEFWPVYGLAPFEEALPYQNNNIQIVPLGLLRFFTRPRDKVVNFQNVKTMPKIKKL